MLNLPPAVVENIRNKETVLFVGAGFSISAGFPSASSIAWLLARKLQQDGKNIDVATAGQLDKAAALFGNTYGRGRLVSEVESFLKTTPQDVLSPSHQLLASLVKHGFVKKIVTTNYDTLIEDACARAGVPINVIAHESHLHSAAGDVPVLYKIHGDFSHPELLVLTPSDLQSWSQRSEVRPIVTQLQALFDTNALLFLGYSLSDFNILTLLLGADFSTRGAPRHMRYAAVYSEENLDDTKMQLREYKVEGFHYPDTEGLLRSILLRLPVKLRIKHLVFNYPSWYPDQHAKYGGIETFIDCLERYSGDFVHEEVSVYHGGTLSASPAQFQYSTYPNYPASFFFFRAVAKAGVEHLLEERRRSRADMPDVIHVHFLAFAPMCEEAGFPTVCTSHSLLSLDLAFTKGLFDGHASPGTRQEVMAVYDAERAAAAAARFVTVVSTAHEQEVRRLGARSVQRLDAPFDASQFRFEEEPRTARERAQLSEKFTVTYVGRPDRRKGIEILVNACEQLATAGRDFQLLLVGYGFRYGGGKLAFGSGLYSFDTSTLDKKGIRVELRQAYNARDAGLFYLASDVVVVPSLYEPMGYVVLEAMACARPVVAAKVGGIPETLVDGRNGVLFAAGDADELAQKLVALYEDPEARKRLGGQARKDMEARRPLPDVVRDWQQLYRQAAFAFGESLYPSAGLLQIIRTKCERVDVQNSTSVEVYRAAELGCNLAREVIAEQGPALALPEGVPVDGALFRAIAIELQRALRRKGVVAPFSTTALRDVMNDLALAALNSERQKDGLLLRADETKKQLQKPWFQEFIGTTGSNR